ncbi:MAG: HAMP domain-containing histidine kinase [Planctomycetes bacterium]|nr:HAMP domain-containing histidine kinase [Planctomycetota bacterium]
MVKRLQAYLDKLLRLAKLKPLNLAEKCRLQFGAAVIFSLTLALLVPYHWMGKLTEKIALDTGRGVADTFFERHLQIRTVSEKGLPILEESGAVRSQDDRAIKWLRSDETGKIDLTGVTETQNSQIEKLISSDRRFDEAWIDKNLRPAKNNYVKLVKASDSCITCHTPEGTAGVFNKNQIIGVLIVQTPARQIAKTVLMSRIWIIVAWLLAATGAMVAFYSIAQRIILRPVRQLRALVNNIAEGNLDARSAIKTDDEYEKLSDAFNDMLDGLQESQEKLRQANTQLDGKIAQLSDRNIELFKANKLKSEFLANMSHEFRTPLNAILGFAQLLREKPADDYEKSKRYAENIIASGRSLLNMINDLLDLAKTQAGKMELRLEKTSIHQLCESLVSFFIPLTQEKNLQVDLDIAKDIPLIRTDAGKVRQILYNLLSNAIKFTEQDGRVLVSAEMLDEKTVRLAIKDSGPGISQENKEKIFEKFRQLDGSITRQSMGTGLGLAISKELADLLAGTLSLESELGKGATFYLDIPVTLQLEAHPDDKPQQ